MPLPFVAYDSSPGLALARCTRSLSEVMPDSRLATITTGACASIEMAVRSVCGL